MLSHDIHHLVKNAGKAPGTLSYTGKKKYPTTVTVCHYSADHFDEKICHTLEEIIAMTKKPGNLWVDVTGLQHVEWVETILNHFGIHPLTAEDILSNAQRPKLEEFDHYIFVTLKDLDWHKKKKTFSIHQLSLILKEKIVLTFSDCPQTEIIAIRKKLASRPNQRLREQKADYLFYRLLDSQIDEYFIVLEAIGEKIDYTENHILTNPSRHNARQIYRMKRQMLLLRKIIWPMREVVNHLSQLNEKFISHFTRIYLRDLYDHTMQTIDTVETYRDITSSLMDIYLSSLTNRLNEVMKTLTIISTIFIPMTFIASVYGMNFINMPELEWRYGFYFAQGMMVAVAVLMLGYFRWKKWF